MPLDTRLIHSIKSTFADRSSEELAEMIRNPNRGAYSDEAFEAAKLVLEERRLGLSREPIPKPTLRTYSPKELQEIADARLVRQIRVIGGYYYVCSALWTFLFLFFLAIDYPAEAVVWSVVIAGMFLLLGRYVRRFSPAARLAGMFVSILQLPAFPVGTVIGLYCFFKLANADYLFVKHDGTGRPRQS